MQIHYIGTLVLFVQPAASSVRPQIEGEDEDVRQPPCEEEAREEGVEPAAEEAALGGLALVLVVVDAALRAGADLEHTGQESYEELRDGQVVAFDVEVAGAKVDQEHGEEDCDESGVASLDAVGVAVGEAAVVIGARPGVVLAEGARLRLDARLKALGRVGQLEAPGEIAAGVRGEHTGAHPLLADPHAILGRASGLVGTLVKLSPSQLDRQSTRERPAHENMQLRHLF